MLRSAVVAASHPGPAALSPRVPATRDTLRKLVLEALVAQLELHRALRVVELAAGSGPWRADLVIAMEKADASGFWFREGIRSLQAGKGCKLLPDQP